MTRCESNYSVMLSHQTKSPEHVVLNEIVNNNVKQTLVEEATYDIG
jgi:hypothetical protein